MKFLREARLTDFYSKPTLEKAARSIWLAMREHCEDHGLEYEAFKHRDYVGDYTFGFSRCLAILHTISPAKQFLGLPFAEEFWQMIWAAEFQEWEVSYQIRDTMRRFSQRLASVNRAYGDGHQDGISYFAGLPFDGKVMHIGSMFFGEPFACLRYSIKQRGEEAKPADG